MAKDRGMDLFEWAETTPGARVLIAPAPVHVSHAAEALPAAPPPPARAKPTALTNRIAHPALVMPAPLLEGQELRDYQEDFRLQIHEHFAEEDRGLGMAATGAGKTILFAAVSGDYCAIGKRVLILTDQFDLVDQAVEKLRDTTGILADIEQGDREAGTKGAVVVATVQSIGTRLEKYPRDHFALIVCDECDRAIAPQWVKVLEHFHDHAKVLGVTATANRADRKSILAYFKAKIFEIGLLELIDRGFLVPVGVLTLPIKIDLRDAEVEGAEDFDEEKLAQAMEGAFAQVADGIQAHASDRKVLAFTPDRRTSRKFVATCIQSGLNARHVDGESLDRQEIKKDYRAGRFQVLSNPLLLTRGYDEPSVDCIVNLRPTQSEALYWQIIGRGTRLFCPHGCKGPCQHPERKKDLLILDFLYQFKERGPIRPAALLADTPHKRIAIQRILEHSQGAMDLQEAGRLASLELEKSLLAAMMEAQKKHRGKPGEYFRAADFAANLRIPDLLEYVPETDREAAPPDPRLLKKIAGAGLVPETVFCQGHGERILQALRARKEAGLASMKSVFWLRKWGYEDPENTTQDRATKIMRKEFARAGKF